MPSDDSDDWEPELLESQLHGIDPENNTEDIRPSDGGAKRGPKKLPIHWSRVISLSEDADSDIGIFSIEEDTATMAEIPRPPHPRRGGEWAPLFLPTAYSKAHPDISLEQYRLGERRLRILGEEISKHRKRLRDQALAYDKADALE